MQHGRRKLPDTLSPEASSEPREIKAASGGTQIIKEVESETVACGDNPSPQTRLEASTS